MAWQNLASFTTSFLPFSLISDRREELGSAPFEPFISLRTGKSVQFAHKFSIDSYIKTRVSSKALFSIHKYVRQTN